MLHRPKLRPTSAAWLFSRSEIDVTAVCILASVNSFCQRGEAASGSLSETRRSGDKALTLEITDNLSGADLRLRTHSLEEDFRGFRHLIRTVDAREILDLSVGGF